MFVEGFGSSELRRLVIHVSMDGLDRKLSSL